MEFKVGDRVMLKVSPWKGVVRFGKRGKLNPRYVRPFKVLAKVGKVAYMLELPQELSRVHHTFHVFNLKKCYADEPLVMPLEGIHVDDKLQFVEEPVEIMERKIKRLKRSRIPLVKVHWNSKRGPEFTWECEDSFKQKYPQLFTNQASSSTTRGLLTKPTNKRVGPGKKAHGFRVELGGDVGSDSRRSGFVFVLGATTNTVASKGGERRMFSKYDEEEYSDNVNYNDTIINEETRIGFIKSDDDVVWLKDNNRNDEDVLWILLKESIMLRRNLREVQKLKDVEKNDTSIFDDLILIMLERKDVKILEFESSLTSADNETEFEDHLKKLI
ncbi:hypothetical protein Tco_0422063 [Tanacetum coccineum]